MRTRVAALVWGAALAALPAAVQGQTAVDGFDPVVNGAVCAVAPLDNGNIMVAGDFWTIDGVARWDLGRLKPDGSVDAAFSVAVAGPDLPFVTVECLAARMDGRVLVGGYFTSLGGQPHAYLGQLKADGTVDGGFTIGANDAIQCFAALPDGWVLVGGFFGSLAAAARELRPAGDAGGGSAGAAAQPGGVGGDVDP